MYYKSKALALGKFYYCIQAPCNARWQIPLLLFPLLWSNCSLWKHYIFCYTVLYCDPWRGRAQEHEKFRTQFVHRRGSYFKFRNWTSCVNFFCIFVLGYFVGLLGLHKNCSKFWPAPICSCLWLTLLGAVTCAVRFHLCRTHHQLSLKIGSKPKCRSIKRQDSPVCILPKSLYLYASNTS